MKRCHDICELQTPAWPGCQVPSIHLINVRERAEKDKIYMTFFIFSYHHLRHLARPMARHQPLKLSKIPVGESQGSGHQTPSTPLHHTHPRARAPGSGDHRALEQHAEAAACWPALCSKQMDPCRFKAYIGCYCPNLTVLPLLSNGAMEIAHLLITVTLIHVVAGGRGKVGAPSLFAQKYPRLARPPAEMVYRKRKRTDNVEAEYLDLPAVGSQVLTPGTMKGSLSTSSINRLTTILIRWIVDCDGGASDWVTF